MVPAFGFGVGDFVAVASLLWKISQALSETSEDSKLYREFQLELSAFQGVVVQFQQAMPNGPILSKDQVTKTRNVVAQIERLINDFNRHMDKFKKNTSPTEKDGTRKLVNLRKRVTWSFFGKKPIQQFREALRGYTAVLTLIMHSLNSQAMQDLQQQVRDGTHCLNLQVQTGTEQLKLHMDTLQDPWDQKPIRFQDAIGRRYPVPLEGFQDFLHHAFKDSPISKAVQQQSIWLFSPVAGETKTWNLIATGDWQANVYPGMQLSMSVFAGRPVGNRFFDIPEEAEVRFQTPLPLWASASFPEDAQFRRRVLKRRSSSSTPLICHEESSKRRMITPKTLDVQTPTASYACPNEAGCGKSFESQPELHEHLKPELFTSDSLKPFLSKGYSITSYGPLCLACRSCVGRKIDTTEEAFTAGIELQKRLTTSCNGLAWCIAEIVTSVDFEADLICYACFTNRLPRIGQHVSPLYAAAAKGFMPLVEMHLRNGTDVNVQGLHRGTPLQAAAREGWEDIVELLLDKGAIVNARDEYHSTALHTASAKGHTRIAELLLRHGADPNIQGKRGIDTPLQAAARAGYEEVVKLLVDKGAIVDARGGDGGTALYAAVAEGHKHIAELLLSHGANYP
ncbi:hypothetical protein ACN42_g10641 [Penicillium freii]|uniref:C2H2-type domain-containing protein n=1 Tax=Penicillium freii TaxID=48697 RepID=A0A117NKS4_PENFR|nr:hypothetical protein ACN42_g10641 [Penicillium freii]